MKLNLILASTLALGLAGTGCATKKYVAQSVNDAITPVQARVNDVESKNGQQDTQIGEHGQQIDTLETNLSRTDERVGSADAKATAAGQAAQQADSKAVAAQQAADNARTMAQRGLTRTDELDKKIDAVNRYQLVASETVLFDLNSYQLSDEAKAKLDDIAKRTGEHGRFIVEIQGFTDKTGSAEANNLLSERRADSVTRYLVNEHQVPLRNLTTIGSGYATPVGDDTTRDGRKMNRRVEVRIFVPEVSGGSQVASND